MAHDTSREDLVLWETTPEGVTVLTMNLPKRYNGWTQPMLTRLRESLLTAARDTHTRALVLTGADPYYCAGVNLSSTLSIDHPKVLHTFIREQNEALFNMFIDFPKPILIAVNGPAIGASVTSATLCDAIIASEKATFSTPFARLGVTPEGCSSVLFPRLIGQSNAHRMLGEEGWVPTAEEALEIGLVDKVVPHESLREEAIALATEWVEQGKERSYRGGAEPDELRRVNARESQALATAFLSPPFLEGQFNFLMSRKKYGPAAMFFLLWRTHPLWSMLL